MASRERTVFGKYRVVARLGRGGVGDVYLAVNLAPAGVSELVAVKELREPLASMPDARSSFLDEARVATRLHHPNVVRTFEVVEEDDAAYLTMEFLDGQPLQNLVRGEKRAFVPVPLQLQILADALGALHDAHELTDDDGAPLAAVHRGVSPHNVFVTYEGGAKLVDFGVARANAARTVTETGVFQGKVRFASPEQALGTDVDRRSDVFAAGGVLWEILTGEPMWKGLPDTKILLALAGGQIPGPRTVKPEVPEGLDAICRKALAFARDDRYATARELRDALLEYLRQTSDVRDPSVALRAAMATAFERERRAIRAVVDAEIRALREASPESMRLRRVPVLGVPPPPAPAGHARVALATKRPPSGRKVVAIALLVCCLLAAGIYSTFPPRPARRPRPAPAAVAPSASTPLAPSVRSP
jgi:serine/threonine-protein kinase